MGIIITIIVAKLRQDIYLITAKLAGTCSPFVLVFPPKREIGHRYWPIKPVGECSPFVLLAT